MKSPQLVRQHQRLTWLIDRTTAAANGELELQSHWAQYACVRAAGFMENALGELYSDYARRCSNAKVGSYVTASVSAVQNPKAARFSETARRFSPEWAEEMDEFLNVDGRREALNSIMTNRHRIAHGEDSDITVVRVRQYLEKCVEIVEFIEGQCRTEEIGQ